MAPVCSVRCGLVVVVPAPELATAARTSRGAAELGSIISYQPDSMRSMDAATQTYVVAHEYGHHLDFMGGEARVEPWRAELRADTLAGCALARLGISPERVRGSSGAESEGAVDVLRAFACGMDSTHPALAWSNAAVRRGANLCARDAPAQSAIVEHADAIADSALVESLRARQRLVDLGERAPCDRVRRR